MKSTGRLMMAVLAVAAFAPLASANVVFDFEGSAQGWGSFGPITTDSGQLVGGGSSGDGRYHVGDFDAAGWGMVDVSPVVDLTGLSTMSVDARFNDVPGFTPFSGTPQMEFMLAIGYAEWTHTVDLTTDYATYSVDFVDLTPNYYAGIAPYFGTVDLDNPNLKLQMVMRGASGSGIGELNYDNVTVTPEPGTMAIAALGAVALVYRRRR